MVTVQSYQRYKHTCVTRSALKITLGMVEDVGKTCGRRVEDAIKNEEDVERREF